MIRVEQLPRKFLVCAGCGAKLSYEPGDEGPPAYDLRRPRGSRDWPSLECPVCARPNIVSGVW